MYYSVGTQGSKMLSLLTIALITGIGLVVVGPDLFRATKQKSVSLVPASRVEAAFAQVFGEK